MNQEGTKNEPRRHQKWTKKAPRMNQEDTKNEPRRHQEWTKKTPRSCKFLGPIFMKVNPLKHLKLIDQDLSIIYDHHWALCIFLS